MVAYFPNYGSITFTSTSYQERTQHWQEQEESSLCASFFHPDLTFSFSYHICSPSNSVLKKDQNPIRILSFGQSPKPPSCLRVDVESLSLMFSRRRWPCLHTNFLSQRYYQSFIQVLRLIFELDTLGSRYRYSAGCVGYRSLTSSVPGFG